MTRNFDEMISNNLRGDTSSFKPSVFTRSYFKTPQVLLLVSEQNLLARYFHALRIKWPVVHSAQRKWICYIQVAILC